MAIGLLYEDKDEVSARTKEFVNRFDEQNGALRCMDILGFYAGSEEGARKYKAQNLKETCNEMVSSAVQILLELVKEWEGQSSL